jgi:HAD superfamily hydrolase (TIGR01509 family)
MTENSKIVAVAFDMDGLIFDSEKIYQYAWQAAGIEVGYPIPDDLYYQFIGLSTQACEKILIEKFGKTFPLKIFRELWIKLRRDKIKKEGVSLKTGFQELFEFLKNQEMRFSLATSSPLEDVFLNFKNTNYLKDFELIITEEQVTRGKPHRVIYELTAEKLGVDPREMLVLEDSNNGMRSAIAAGTIAVMVPDMRPPEADVKIGAFRIVHSLKEVLTLPIFDNHLHR